MSTALMLKNKEKSIKIEMPFNTQSLNNVESTLFLEEVKNYLCSYPKTKHIDICLHDINGHIRGKRIDISCLNKLADGCYFPLSVYAMSLDGKVIEETGLGKFIGEPDFLCKPILGSLKPCPIDPELNAQLFLTMKDNESDCQFEPRNLLKGILSKLHEKNYYPCMAAELEFYLFNNNGSESEIVNNSQCFDINTPSGYQGVLDEVERIAVLQGINITGMVAESSSGQYEINIQHSNDVLKLCDQVMLLKRTIKQVALKHGLSASFLAKPDMHKAGSGMHFHMSILDQNKQNVFSTETKDLLSPQLLKVISGLVLLLPSSMAVIAPNVNSFRRFRIGNHVPLEANWGVNNRNVAIRIPCSDTANQRLEYRVAGADCNPYLTVAMILVGALHGLTQNLEVPKQANQLKRKEEHIFLTTNQLEALALFNGNNIIKEYLGKDFIDFWCTVKHAEYQNIYNQITVIEQNWDI
ncbi:glutamine synthetase [Acinetobacter johnsonii]|uniref:glutamine synthetase family protein n=1 Tax=Acinetobacter johnsonii TaxID=40214 RepID=UPI001322547B|nr:glutamine synthetase [Acinetobacter johnsonii]